MNLTKINFQNNCQIKYDAGEDIILENGLMRTARYPHKLLYPKTLDNDLAYLVGYHLGDGYLEDFNKAFKRRGKGSYEIDYADRDPEQIKLINNIIEDKFRCKIKIYKKPHDNLWIGRMGSCKVLHWFLNKKLEIPMGEKNKIDIPKWILMNEERLSNFLSGFFDAEGDVGKTTNHSNKDKKYFIIRIQLTQKDREILLKIKEILYEKFNVKSNVNKKWNQDAWMLHIWGRKNAILFKEKIDFRNDIKKTKLIKFLER